MLLSTMLIAVMVICSACTQIDVQVKMQEDGTSKFSMETLIGKAEVEMVKPGIQKQFEAQMGAEQAEQMMQTYFGQIESSEVVVVDGKEYYRSIDEASFNDEQELETYLEQKLTGMAKVSVGKDHFYAAMIMDSAANSASNMAGEDMSEEEATAMVDKMLSEMGLTTEQVMQMVTGMKYQFTIELPSNITYSNGVYEPNSSKVTWSYSMADAQQTPEGDMFVLYAETMEPSVLKNDTTAPKISGVKNQAYYKTLNKTLKATDAVNLAGVTVDGTTTESGTKLSDMYLEEGKHTVKAYDFSGNKTEVTFTYDKTKPVVKGVANGKTYKKARTIKFSDKYGVKSAKLNGKTIKTNKKVSKKGSYTLKVTDKAGNTATVKFKIKK